MEFSLVKKSLSKLLQEYRNLRPNLSLRSLSRNIGVNRYFLAKLLDDNDKVKFCIDEILVFCKFIKNNLPNNPQITKELSVIQGFFSEYLGSSDLNFISANEDSGIDFYDRYNFFILVLACCDYGMTKEKIVSVLGENCLSNYAALLEEGYIEELPSGTVRMPDGATTCFSQALLSYHSGELLKYYRLTHQEQSRNYLDVRFQSLSKEALLKVIELQRECDKKVFDIIANEKNFGPNPMFSLSCVDTFVDELK